MYGHEIEVKTEKDKASVNWEYNSVINHRFILCCHEEYNFMIHQSSGVHVSTIWLYCGLKSAMIDFSPFHLDTSAMCVNAGADQLCCSFNFNFGRNKIKKVYPPHKPKLLVSSLMVCYSWYGREVHLKSGQGDAVLYIRLLCTFKLKHNIEESKSIHWRLWEGGKVSGEPKLHKMLFTHTGGDSPDCGMNNTQQMRLSLWLINSWTIPA